MTILTDEEFMDFDVSNYKKIRRNYYDADGYNIVKKKATSKRRQNKKIHFEEEIDFEEDNY